MPPTTRTKSFSEALINWPVAKVITWLDSIGYGSLEQTFSDHLITGDILIKLNDDILKELSVTRIGDRITLLNAIYKLKIHHGIPLSHEDYVPP